ncbi:hypothetical protein ACWEKT_29315 [Nocardia takedensis]
MNSIPAMMPHQLVRRVGQLPMVRSVGEATATDNAVWPHGKWLDAAISTFDNGTRLDGSAEWSIN